MTNATALFIAAGFAVMQGGVGDMWAALFLICAVGSYVSNGNKRNTP